jgi:predicted LPLAT superfamily acyltransferase
MSDALSQPSSAPRVQWAEPDVGPSWRFRFFGWLLRWGGLTRAYHISYFATLWYVLFYPSIRARCRFYLDRRFPERRGPLRRFLDSYRLVRTFGKTLVDMAAIGVTGNDALSALSPDRERLGGLATGNKGFIMLHAHVGCWQVGMSTTGNFAKPVWIVMIPEPRTLAMFESGNADVIDPRTGLDAVMRMTEALLRGEIVAMMGDRTFGDDRNRVDAHFLGGTIKLPITPYRLASASGMPVVVMLTPKVAERAYEMRVARVIDVPPGLGRVPEHYAPYAEQFADCLERFVAEYPWQFFNFFDLWKRS